MNNSGKVDAVDRGQVSAAFNGLAGVAGPVYRRTLDLNNPTTANATGGRGSGKIDAVDLGLVNGQFNKTCIFEP